MWHMFWWVLNTKNDDDSRLTIVRDRIKWSGLYFESGLSIKPRCIMGKNHQIPHDLLNGTTCFICDRSGDSINYNISNQYDTSHRKN